MGVGKMRVPFYDAMPATTMAMLGRSQKLHCMSYFPMVYHRDHISQLRAHLEALHRKPISSLLRHVYNRSDTYCPWELPPEFCSRSFCQFNILCNYIAEAHRDSYSFHAQVIGKGWKGFRYALPAVSVDVPDFVDVAPRARVALHAGHMGTWIHMTKCHHSHSMKCRWSPLAMSKVVEGFCRSI